MTDELAGDEELGWLLAPATLLERRFPEIPWRTPLRVTRTDGAAGWACRFCIAAYGLKASAIPELAQSPEEVLEHLEREHPR